MSKSQWICIKLLKCLKKKMIIFLTPAETAELPSTCLEKVIVVGVLDGSDAGWDILYLI